LAGIGLAGVWSSSRVLLTALTPAEKSGEFWGLYNLSGRTASVLGDATWSLVLTLLGERVFGYQVAIVALAVYVLLGGVIITTLPDVRPSPRSFLSLP
jgi:UMF1 family MFS transporter